MGFPSGPACVSRPSPDASRGSCRASRPGAGPLPSPAHPSPRDNQRVLLAIDVGNTQSHLGVFANGDLAEHWRFATEAEETADELAVRVSTLLALRAIDL